MFCAGPVCSESPSSVHCLEDSWSFLGCYACYHILASYIPLIRGPCVYNIDKILLHYRHSIFVLVPAYSERRASLHIYYARCFGHGTHRSPHRALDVYKFDRYPDFPISCRRFLGAVPAYPHAALSGARLSHSICDLSLVYLLYFWCKTIEKTFYAILLSCGFFFDTIFVCIVAFICLENMITDFAYPIYKCSIIYSLSS